MAGNRLRMLAQVISIDAWHQPFRTDGGLSSVHVEITFQEGRMGGEDESLPFTFRVRLKKAILTIKPETPLKVDRASVARPMIKHESEQEQTSELRSTKKFGSDISGAIAADNRNTDISGKISASSGKTLTEERIEKVKLIQEIPIVLVTAQSTPNAYSWEMIPGHGDYLRGQPWHPVEEPRLSLKSLTRKSSIDPSIKVTLSCLFEDIVIEDIKIKRDDFLSLAKETIFKEANVKSACQYIKIALKNADIEIGAIDNRFADIILADLIASEE